MATAPKNTSTPSDAAAPEDRSLFSLLRDLPGLLLELVRVEVEQVKREMARKLKNLGVGALLVVIAMSLLTFLFGTLIAAAIFGLAEVVPTWAAALIVSGILLIIIVVLLAVAALRFKKGSPPLPTESFDSIVEDANALKGEGRYDKR